MNIKVHKLFIYLVITSNLRASCIEHRLVAYSVYIVYISIMLGLHNHVSDHCFSVSHNLNVYFFYSLISTDK